MDGARLGVIATDYTSGALWNTNFRFRAPYLTGGVHQTCGTVEVVGINTACLRRLSLPAKAASGGAYVGAVTLMAVRGR